MSGFFYHTFEPREVSLILKIMVTFLIMHNRLDDPCSLMALSNQHVLLLAYQKYVIN